MPWRMYCFLRVVLLIETIIVGFLQLAHPYSAVPVTGDAPHAVVPKQIKMDSAHDNTHSKSISNKREGEPRLTTESEYSTSFSAVTPMNLARAVCTPFQDSETEVTEPIVTEHSTTKDLPDKIPVVRDHGSSPSSNQDKQLQMIRSEPGSDQSEGKSKPKSFRAPRSSLTLSAFRRPENTVRIACHDSSRTIESEYDLDGRTLGHGAFSTVRLAMRQSDGEPVAVKTIAKHQVLRSRRTRCHRKRLEEWELLHMFENNPNIVTPLDVFETDEEIQLVLEYCDGGELFDVVQRHKNDAESSEHGRYEFPQDQASVIARHVLTALTDLHSRGIAHRDVKPENILLKTTEAGDVCVKLSDFGTARVFHRSSLTDSSDEESDGESSPCTPPSRMRAYSSVGSHFYTAPEVDDNDGYGTAVDIYSLGVTLYVLLCGDPPSATIDTDDDGEELAGSVWTDLSPEVRDLIHNMLHPDPSMRITADAALRHEWIASTSDWELRMANGRFRRHDQEALSRRRSSTMSDSSHGLRKRPSFTLEGPSKKSRSNEQVEAGALIAAAMAKLYSGVAAAAQSASDAAACVVFDDIGQDIRILDDANVDDRDETNNCEDDARASPLESSLTALSV